MMKVTEEMVRWAYRLFLGREAESQTVVEDKLSRLADTRALREEFLGSAEFLSANPGQFSAELVIWAYRLLLEREPENRQVIDDKLIRFKSTHDLRKEFLYCQEYLAANPEAHTATLSGHEPPLEIEEDLSPEQQEALFRHIQSTWQHLGETEPHWSVLTHDVYLQAQLSQSEFYASGRIEAERLIKTLERNRLDPADFTTCLEYGCGLGRVTEWLARRFTRVTGCDISASHLQLAERHLQEQKLDNVDLLQIRQPEDLFKLPQVDLIFSIIVLQHNPPPLIALTLKQLVASLNPGGVAMFQLPTYSMSYRFRLQDYLKNRVGSQKMEMHIFPQHRVLDIVYAGGARVIEILEDDHFATRSKEVSNTFLIQKSALPDPADR